MTVIITGATNGIGRAAAKALVARGVDVAIVARNESRAQQAVDRIAKAGDGRRPPVDALVADLSSQEQVRTLAGEIITRYLRLSEATVDAGRVNLSLADLRTGRG